MKNLILVPAVLIFILITSCSSQLNIHSPYNVEQQVNFEARNVGFSPNDKPVSIEFKQSNCVLTIKCQTFTLTESSDFTCKFDGTGNTLNIECHKLIHKRKAEFQGKNDTLKNNYVFFRYEKLKGNGAFSTNGSQSIKLFQILKRKR